MAENSDSKNLLFRQIRNLLGAPIRKVELEDSNLCAAYDWGRKTYSQKVINYITTANWSSVYGKEADSVSLANVLSMRSLDLSRNYASWFSARVGLQSYGNYELKEDFIPLEDGKDNYYVPKGREIHKVMYFMPSDVDKSALLCGGGAQVGFGGGVFGQLGYPNTFSSMGGGAYGYGTPMVPLADWSLYSMHLSQTRKQMGGFLSYYVTAAGDGGHIIHLLDGGQGVKYPTMRWTRELTNCYIWYHYYDNVTDVNDCLKQDSDIIVSPDQLKLEELDYENMNPSAQQYVLQFTYAQALHTLAFIRGKFSGQINMVSSTLSMDYAMLNTQADNIESKASEELKDYLKELSPYEILKKDAEAQDSIRKVLQGTPLGIYLK